MAPTLWEAAQGVTLRQAIPVGDPQGERMWGVAGTGTAPNLSTERLKITLWGPPEQLTLSLGKTDVWDRRVVEQPVLTLAHIRETYAVGSTPGSDHYSAWAAYDFPCPKPVGQVILGCADLRGAGQPTAVVHCDDGAARVEVRHGAAQATLTYLPMMTRNLMAVRAEYEGLSNAVSVRLYRHRDVCTPGLRHAGGNAFAPKPSPKHDYAADGAFGLVPPPTSGVEGRLFWIRQVLPAEKTFPAGFEYVLAGVVVGAEAALENVDGETGLGAVPRLTPEQQALYDSRGTYWGSLPNYDEIRAAPGSAATATMAAQSSPRFTVLVAVVTSAEAADPLAAACGMLAAAEEAGFEGLRAENAAWRQRFYERRERGRIFRGSAEFTRAQVPDVFYSWRSQHHSSGCLSDPKRYEADTTYAWLESDWANWHGIPCYNELFFTHAHVRNRSDRLSYYYNLLDVWWPAFQRNARETFGLPGAAVLHGYQPPVKPDRYCHTHSVWEFCMEIPAQVLKLLWDCCDYGGDDEMLRTAVYPKMRDVAEFYRHYVTLGEDGFWHVIPTVVAEYYQWRDSPNMMRTRDTTSALCMFKWQLETTAAAAERLGVDAPLRERWLEVAANLAPYPLFETPEGPVFSDIPAAPAGEGGKSPVDIANYNFYPGYYPCILADEVNLDSPPEQIEMMLRTARLVRGWLREVPPLLLGAVRVGESLSAWEGFGNWDGSGKRVGVSAWTSLKEWLGMESEQDVFAESLLNSRGGRIHLFPGVKPDETIAFREFQARGGFAVSAECVRGKVTFVELRARRDETCRLMNPWPGVAVKVRAAPGGEFVAHQVDEQRGECIVFPARAGQAYSVAPGPHSGARA